MSVSMQHEHIWAILYNPFLIGLCIGFDVGKCRHTIMLNKYAQLQYIYFSQSRKLWVQAFDKLVFSFPLDPRKPSVYLFTFLPCLSICQLRELEQVLVLVTINLADMGSWFYHPPLLNLDESFLLDFQPLQPGVIYNCTHHKQKRKF